MSDAAAKAAKECSPRRKPWVNLGNRDEPPKGRKKMVRRIGRKNCDWVKRGPLSRSKGKRKAERNIPPYRLQLELGGSGLLYPFTLIFENDNTALLGVGRPIDSAGR
jgi:hypothetical protein